MAGQGRESRDKALLASRPQAADGAGEGGGGLHFCPPEARILLPSLEADPPGEHLGNHRSLFAGWGPAYGPPAFSIDYVLTDLSVIWAANQRQKILPI